MRAGEPVAAPSCVCESEGVAACVCVREGVAWCSVREGDPVAAPSCVCVLNAWVRGRVSVRVSVRVCAHCNQAHRLSLCQVCW